MVLLTLSTYVAAAQAGCAGSPALPGWHVYLCGLLCFQAQSQDHGGDSRRPAIAQGELDRAVEGHEPTSRTGI